MAQEVALGLIGYYLGLSSKTPRRDLTAAEEPTLCPQALHDWRTVEQVGRDLVRCQLAPEIVQSVKSGRGALDTVSKGLPPCYAYHLT